jgi:hypothetical protein
LRSWESSKGPGASGELKPTPGNAKLLKAAFDIARKGSTEQTKERRRERSDRAKMSEIYDRMNKGGKR